MKGQQLYKKIFKITNHHRNEKSKPELDITLQLSEWLLQKGQKQISIG